MPTGLRADAARNRGKLMSAAAVLFAERGVGVPLDDIAKSAGVSIGTLYNHFSNRGALLDAVLPERLAELSALAEAALADPDPWHGFTQYLDALFGMLSRDRAINDAIARNPVGAVDLDTECGRAAGLLASIAQRARDADRLRADVGTTDLTTLVFAMSKVIEMSDGDDSVWRRHLGFILDGLRVRT